MRLRLDSESGVPYYQQVVQQIRRLIVSGTLAPGDRLPTVRELAVTLTLNPNTVARAYQDLEREGSVETRRGQGTYACAPSRSLSQTERIEIITKLLDQALLEAQNLGFSPHELLELLNKRMEETYEQPIPA